MMYTLVGHITRGIEHSTATWYYPVVIVTIHKVIYRIALPCAIAQVFLFS